jgi:uncharacterized membrane protein
MEIFWNQEIVNMPMLPFILFLVGVIGLAIAGYLGGELVFRHGVTCRPGRHKRQSHQIAFMRRSKSGLLSEGKA